MNPLNYTWHHPLGGGGGANCKFHLYLYSFKLNKRYVIFITFLQHSQQIFCGKLLHVVTIGYESNFNSGFKLKA